MDDGRMSGVTGTTLTAFPSSQSHFTNEVEMKSVMRKWSQPRDPAAPVISWYFFGGCVCDGVSTEQRAIGQCLCDLEGLVTRC
jgi:hypothetical protein